MAKANRECCVCQKRYEYCNSCNHHDPSWKASFCSEECRKIYDTLIAYNNKRIDAETAKKELADCLPEDFENFREGSKRLLTEILRTKPEIQKEPKKSKKIKANNGDKND